MCNCKRYDQVEKYRIARGNLKEAIQNFNDAIKELEMKLLIYQVEYPESKKIMMRLVYKVIYMEYI